MRSNYKRLGQYIKPVNKRNDDLKVSLLLGVSIQKVFIKSIANTVGTNFKNYKVVKKDQFAYGPVTSRNGDKISVALLEEDECIISSSYTVFRIIDKEVLLPEYLMMWFRRPEFDRYARYMSHGSVREIFGWEEMCNVELPIPDIEKQREIVEEYNTIVNRIELNQKLNQKLEETAQALYKHWFVDFEFPNEEGKPYKSSGGEMVYNEELDDEIPMGWTVDTIDTIAKDVICGKTPPTEDSANYGSDIPFLTIPDMHNKVFADTYDRYLSFKGAKTQINKTLPPYSICVSCIGTAGLTILTSVECQTNQQINSIICKDGISAFYIYLVMKNMARDINEFSNRGSVGKNMNKTEFSNLLIVNPKKEIQDGYENVVKMLFEYILAIQKKLVDLNGLKELISTKIAKAAL